MNYMESGMADVARRLHEAQTQRDELLEALEALLADYVYADGEGVIDVSGADSAEKARAAIAKARGETK